MEKSVRFTKGEEIANSISHGLGAGLSVAATVLIVILAVKTGDATCITSCAIFGATMIMLYLSSTLNHSLRAGKAKEFFHNFDQIAIYFLIAGTYTPIALGIIRNDGGWWMFGIEWGFALVGIILKLFMPNKFEKGVNSFTIVSYIVMGWLLLFFIPQLHAGMPTISLVYLLIGGFFYTFGVLFFKMEKVKQAHLIWHLFVVGGTVFHWFAIFIALK